MIWHPTSYAEGLRMAWDENDDGVEHCLAQILPYVPHGFGRVLDFGCGVGRLTIPLSRARRSAEFWGYDTSESMIFYAQAMNDRPNVYFTDRLYTVPKIDMVISVVTFQHMSDDDVRAVIRGAGEAEATMVFQFVEGTEREPLSMQRDSAEVMDWCVDVGYDVEATRDDRFENWWWFVCR